MTTLISTNVPDHLMDVIFILYAAIVTYKTYHVVFPYIGYAGLDDDCDDKFEQMTYDGRISLPVGTPVTRAERSAIKCLQAKRIVALLTKNPSRSMSNDFCHQYVFAILDIAYDISVLDHDIVQQYLAKTRMLSTRTRAILRAMSRGNFRFVQVIGTSFKTLRQMETIEMENQYFDMSYPVQFNIPFNSWPPEWVDVFIESYEFRENITRVQELVYLAGWMLYMYGTSPNMERLISMVVSDDDVISLLIDVFGDHVMDTTTPLVQLLFAYSFAGCFNILPEDFASVILQLPGVCSSLAAFLVNRFPCKDTVRFINYLRNIIRSFIYKYSRETISLYTELCAHAIRADHECGGLVNHMVWKSIVHPFDELYNRARSITRSMKKKRNRLARAKRLLL